MLNAILFWLFILSIAIQCSYALYFFTRIFYLPQKEKTDQQKTLPVSIIICAKNEEDNLRQNLPLILAQRYSNAAGQPMYEVIVVNDASDDATEVVLEKLEQEYLHLKHIAISKNARRDFKGKKFALSKGVEAANHSLLLFTDADCVPASEHWLRLMVAPLENGKEIVAGYGAYEYKPGLLNAFVRWETLHTFLQYSTYLMAGKPYMSVGRNMAATKDVFIKAQESAIWNALPSGDDDLLVRICATADNTAIVAHPDAFTFSPAKTNWHDWLKQKQRHISTGKYYKKEIQFLLGLYALSHTAIWVLFFVLIFIKGWGLILLLMLFRCVMYWAIWQTTASKLKEKYFSLWMPVCDFGWMIYNLILSPYIFWKNKQQWK